MHRGVYEQVRRRGGENRSEADSCEVSAMPAALESISSWTETDTIRVPFKVPGEDSCDGSEIESVTSLQSRREAPRLSPMETEQLLMQMRIQNQMARQMEMSDSWPHAPSANVLRSPAVYHVTAPSCCKKKDSSGDESGPQEFATLADAIKGLSANQIYGAHSFDPTLIIISLGFVIALIGASATFLISRRQRTRQPSPTAIMMARAAALRQSSSTSTSSYSSSTDEHNKYY